MVWTAVRAEGLLRMEKRADSFRAQLLLAEGFVKRGIVSSAEVCQCLGQD